jgi:transcriptional regulator with XRE-family HTH domain
MSSTLTAIKLDRLRELREKHGWSQRELGRRCDISDSMINKYELGITEPSAKYLAIIADQLGVSVDYLLGRTNVESVAVSENTLDEDQLLLLDTFRREGWVGVIGLGTKHVVDKKRE